MTIDSPPVSLSFADIWAHPDPNGAEYDAFIEVTCREWAQLGPKQLAAAYVWRYVGEVNNGGHSQYFMNLDLHWDVREHVPATTNALKGLGLSRQSKILATAFRRWKKAPSPTQDQIDAAPEGAVFYFDDFNDLDEKFYALDQEGSKHRPYDALARHFRAHRELYVTVSPAGVEDEPLLKFGPSSESGSIRREDWLDLLKHQNPRVQIRAAEALLETDKDAAMSVLCSVRDNRSRYPYPIWSKACSALFWIESPVGLAKLG